MSGPSSSATTRPAEALDLDALTASPGQVAAVIGTVCGLTLAGVAADAWRRRRLAQAAEAADEEKQRTSRPRGWVLGMLVSSYALLLPGLVCQLLSAEIKLIIFGIPKPLTSLSENMFQLVHRLGSEHLIIGSILVTLYAVVIPVLKVVLLGVGHYLQNGDARQVRTARRCILLVQLVSKWASPDMFAYILLMYLFRSLHNPPSLISDMRLGAGFSCFCVFCVGSTISSLGIRVPELPAEDTAAAQQAPRGCRISARAAAGASVALSIAFCALLAVGATTTCMSLHLDMPLLYETNPTLRALAPIIDKLGLGALLNADVSVWKCIAGLCEWIAEGDANCLLAFIMYAVFAMLLPALDMATLVAASISLWRGASNADALLSVSRVLKKVSMLDVSIMGSVIVVMSLKNMRENGVMVTLQPGTLALLAAELCHHLAAGLVRRAFDGAGAGAGAGAAARDVRAKEEGMANPEGISEVIDVEVADDLEKKTFAKGHTLDSQVSTCLGDDAAAAADRDGGDEGDSEGAAEAQTEAQGPGGAGGLASPCASV